MVGAIDAALRAWESDPAVALVLIDGVGERAFCAGGDIAGDLCIWRGAATLPGARAFWGNEYRMDALIARYPQALCRADARIRHGRRGRRSAHGSHRMVGESAQVAMPECGIGLVPDIGGTQLLADAPGRLGEYLGLTGARMGPGDAISRASPTACARGGMAGARRRAGRDRRPGAVAPRLARRRSRRWRRCGRRSTTPSRPPTSRR